MIIMITFVKLSKQDMSNCSEFGIYVFEVIVIQAKNRISKKSDHAP